MPALFHAAYSAKRIDQLNSEPTASFLLAKDEFCLDETLQITNTSVNADTFQWNFCIGALTGTGNASQLVDLPIQSSF
ncbi:MAG: hypothetical protein RIF33_07440, partial [Cyclobacteriaceae bacterium]